MPVVAAVGDPGVDSGVGSGLDSGVDAGGTDRVRRPPPRFREVAVGSVERRSPYLVRVVFEADGLAALLGDQPAASVRLLLPDAAGTLAMPTWVGNEFLAADGSRPAIRTLTPLRVPGRDDALACEVVLHDRGLLSAWAGTVVPGGRAALSGPGRGTDLAPEARRWLVAGDESALPAVTTLLEALAPEVTVDAVVEVRHRDAVVALPGHPGATLHWVERAGADVPGEALVAHVDAAVSRAEFAPEDLWVWAAGEAAAVQRIRRVVAGEGIPRARTVIRGYWKAGRALPG